MSSYQSDNSRVLQGEQKATQSHPPALIFIPCGWCARNKTGKMRIPMRCASLFLLAFLASVTAKTTWCKSSAHRSSAEPHGNYSRTVDELEPTLVCVSNAPVSAKLLLGGALLRLFDVQTVHVRGLRPGVEVYAASEDTWLVGAMSGQSAEEQVKAAFKTENRSFAQERWADLSRALSTVWYGSDRRSQSFGFSPFSPSCVGLRSRNGPVDVTVELFREGPLAGLSTSDIDRLFRGGDRNVPLYLWSWPALFVAGFLVFAYAPTLADSIVFHYASGVSVSMLLGVLIIVIILWQRTGSRRPGVFAASLLSAVGLTATALKDWLREAFREFVITHWQYTLAYLSVFAAIGYFYTFWRLRGGRPEEFECVMLSQFMRLVSLLFIWFSSHSLRAAIALLLGVIGAFGLPSRVYTPFRVLYARAIERGPAKAPRDYELEVNGKRVRRAWRPATRSGRYLSQEEYEHQRDATTSAGMRKLIASPAYQKWLLDNHHRLSLSSEGAPMRQPELYEDDGDE
jgi:hypothetical protein